MVSKGHLSYENGIGLVYSELSDDELISLATKEERPMKIWLMLNRFMDSNLVEEVKKRAMEIMEIDKSLRYDNNLSKKQIQQLMSMQHKLDNELHNFQMKSIESIKITHKEGDVFNFGDYMFNINYNNMATEIRIVKITPKSIVISYDGKFKYQPIENKIIRFTKGDFNRLYYRIMTNKNYRRDLTLNAIRKINK